MDTTCVVYSLNGIQFIRRQAPSRATNTNIKSVIRASIRKKVWSLWVNPILIAFIIVNNCVIYYNNCFYCIIAV